MSTPHSEKSTPQWVYDWGIKPYATPQLNVKVNEEKVAKVVAKLAVEKELTEQDQKELTAYLHDSAWDKGRMLYQNREEYAARESARQRLIAWIMLITTALTCCTWINLAEKAASEDDYLAMIFMLYTICAVIGTATLGHSNILFNKAWEKYTKQHQSFFDDLGIE